MYVHVHVRICMCITDTRMCMCMGMGMGMGMGMNKCVFAGPCRQYETAVKPPTIPPPPPGLGFQSWGFSLRFYRLGNPARGPQANPKF